MKKVLTKALSLLVVLSMVMTVVAMPILVSAGETTSLFLEDFTGETIALGESFGETTMFYKKTSSNNGGSFVVTEDGVLSKPAPTNGNNGRETHAYIKFDKDYDMSAEGPGKKLIISYDIRGINSVIKEDATRKYVIKKAAMNLLSYDSETDVATAITGFAGNTGSTGVFYNGGNHCTTIFVWEREELEDGTYGNIVANGFGHYVGNATRAPLANIIKFDGKVYSDYNETGGTSLGGGIVGNTLETVYNCTYEVSPATETEPAKVTKLTITDGINTKELTDFNASTKTQGNLTDTTVSGMRLEFDSHVTAEVDNIAVYYEGALPVPAVTVNGEALEGKVFASDSFDATITFENAVTSDDIAKIAVNNDAIVEASFADTANKVVNISVTNCESFKGYTLTVPKMGLNEGTTVNFSTGAFMYGENDIYYEGFDTDATINIGTNFDSADIYRTKHNSSNASAAVSDGKLVFTKASRDGDESTSDSAKGQGIVDNVYLKFDKAFDVSANTTKKLYITYDVTPISANFNEYTDKANTTENTSLYRALPMNVAPIYYDGVTKTATNLSGVQPSGYWTNTACTTYLAYKRSEVSETDNIVTAGMGYYIGNASRSPVAKIDPEASTPAKFTTEAQCGGGIINNSIGTAYTVTLEVTPATADVPAKISKVSITDGTLIYSNSDFVIQNGTDKGILSGTTVSGVNIGICAMQTVEIDNVKAYYEGALPVPAVTVNGEALEGKVFASDSFDATITFENAVTSDDIAKIAIDNDAIVEASFADTANKVVNISVTNLDANKNYILSVPATTLNLDKTFNFKTGNVMYGADGYFVEDFSDVTFTKVSNFANSDYIYQQANRKVSTVSTANGKLELTLNPESADIPNGKAEALTQAYIKFNKSFDVSAGNKNLVVSFEVTGDDALFKEDYTEEFSSFRFGALPINYDESFVPAAVSGAPMSGAHWTNGSAAPFLVFRRDVQTSTDEENNEVVTYGDLVSGGIGLKQPINNMAPNYENVTSTEPGTAWLKNSTGYAILNNPINTVYTVTYVITPGANTADESLARITKFTMTDGTNTIEIDNTENEYTQWNLTSNTVSGLNLSAYSYASCSFDNVKVYYEGALEEAVVEYEGAELNDALIAEGITTINATVTYPMAVTAEDVVIGINNGAIVEIGEISEDGKTVAITISNLGQNITYTLNVKGIGNMANTAVKFKTDVVVASYINAPTIEIVDGIAKASVECITRAADTFALILAGYNGDVVETIEIRPVSTDGKKEVQSFSSLNGISTNGLTKFRAFIWEDVDTATPITLGAELFIEVEVPEA